MGPDPALELAGRRIIITRSVADNQSLGAALRSLGADVVEVPLVEVLPPLDGGTELRAIVDRLHAYDWVVLTSVNAVDALVAAVASVGSEAPWPADLQVAAVGPTTAAAATAAGVTVGLVPQVATAAAMVEAFPVSLSVSVESAPVESARNRVLAPLAELAGPTVEGGPNEKGYRVDRITAYRTAAPIVSDDHDGAPGLDPAMAAAADAVAFFSPSAVDRFVARFGPIPEMAVCVGPSTAERARSHGFAEVRMAEPHTEPAVIESIRSRLVSRSD